MSGIIAILVANIIWGASPPVFKYALGSIPPYTLGFIRFFGAGLIFLPFALLHMRKLTSHEWGHVILGAVWGIAINIMFFFIGLPLAPSINVHIISSLGPIVLYFLSLLFLKEKAHPQVMRGMIVSLLGVAFILFFPFVSGGIKSDGVQYTALSSLLGNLCFIISMFGGVMLAIHNKKISKTVHPYLLTFLQFMIGALAFLPVMLIELSEGTPFVLNTGSWAGIVYGIFLASAAGYFLHNYALTRMDAQQIGIYTYIMPVIGVLVAIPLLGEYPDVYFLIGSLCIGLGIWISERHPHFRSIHKR